LVITALRTRVAVLWNSRSHRILASLDRKRLGGLQPGRKWQPALVVTEPGYRALPLTSHAALSARPANYSKRDSCR